MGEPTMKVVDGTFVEEPGSGAVATVENKKVSVGTFDWVQRYCGDNLVYSVGNGRREVWVADVWSHSEGGVWAPTFSRRINDWEVFDVEHLLLRLQGRRVYSDVEDQVIWTKAKDGRFSVKSLYKALEPERLRDFPARVIWNSLEFFGASEGEFFAWEASWKKALTLDRIHKEGSPWLIDVICVWVSWVLPSSVREASLGWFGPCVGKERKKVWFSAPLCLFWIVWKERNGRAFENEEHSIHECKSFFLYNLHGVQENPFQEVDELKNQSVVYVGVDGTLAGLIYFEDQIRDDARHVVESLSRQGISVYMLSGDKRNAAEHVASSVGIPKDKVLSGVKPNEKSKFIRELQKAHNTVAMVGDGINDAAALASSDIGIAMGGGVGAASEVSSIVLMGNRLSQLLDAFELSRLTMKTVKQNLWWAFAYNIVGIPIAAGMLLPITGTMLTPSIAGALMGLSSVGVMTNSLLLRSKFSAKQKQIYEASPNSKAYLVSDRPGDQKEKLKQHSYSPSR
ncbi:Copper-transporting ATPase PAA1, chloroplastic [Vitis vinifera]|uniref:Copper-transporting ATPase PAA1, chloroplastic n=1 Tax=Vitis vinifera TaxID=29760 RepID=A0A438H3N6_VITVI|nr:Copper-transporting ATPase PAA1, chloroplastic [Vitis vinifera]